MNSKPVFRVDTDSGRFAAKFHDPQEHELSQKMGEMQFLSHVSEHTELCIETPVANADGAFVTEVRSEWLREPAHVALCTWVPGRSLRDAVTVGAYRLLGECASLLHQASAAFRPRPEFRILTNDRVFYWDAETILSRKDSRLLPKRRQDRFRRGAQLAEEAIRKIWKSGSPIVVHNDLHPSNIKVRRDELSLYDFEDITWGFPEQDIGTAMYYTRFRDDYAALLGAFRDGYERVLAWPFESNEQVDFFVMARLLMLANYVVNYGIRPLQHLPRFDGNLKTLLGATRWEDAG
ncbi:MAG: phosphotransferase enzyme family protein [Planctomycetota bacterium]